MGKTGNSAIEIIHPNATYIKTKNSYPAGTAVASGNYFSLLSKVIMDGEVKSASEVLTNSGGSISFLNGGEHEYYLYRSAGWATDNGYAYFYQSNAKYIEIFRPNRNCTNAMQGDMRTLDVMMLLGNNVRFSNVAAYPKSIYVTRGSTAYSSLGANIIETDYNIIED